MAIVTMEGVQEPSVSFLSGYANKNDPMKQTKSMVTTDTVMLFFSPKLTHRVHYPKMLVRPSFEEKQKCFSILDML